MHDFFDQYSVLHFATGVTAYFWGVGPWVWVLGHLAWEGFENSGVGLKLVNRFWHWPGRKGPMKQDTLANTIGDNISAQAGYGVPNGWTSTARSMTGTENMMR